MKTLVVYYSRTQNTKKIAEEIASKLKCSIEELIDLKSRKGIFGYIKGGHEALVKGHTELWDLRHDPSKYDLVIIGTPVWGGMVTPAVRTFIRDNKKKLGKVAFFCTMAGKSDQKTFAGMEKLSKKPIATLAVRSREVKKDLYEEKLEEYIGKIL
ncbi:hypothetical protein H8D36_06050 [archaeon]|nr:hypothetical protein [archaeon]MBL7056983.1 hypothetical protein [Candidatus Woesearchaeota archaeon]